MDTTTISISPRAKRLTGWTLAATAALLLIGAGSCNGNSNTATSNNSSNVQYDGQNLSNQAVANFRQNPHDTYDPSKLNYSTELANLNERLFRYNNPSKISYIYLLSNTGAVISYYTVKGKVSSNGSQMTPDQNIVDGCPSSTGKDAVGVCPTVVNAPEDDGSYGPNEPGIFFFTTDDVMITWDGPFLLSDAPLKINPATLTLTYQDGSKPTSNGGFLGGK